MAAAAVPGAGVTLLLGGARSGKSTLALQLAERCSAPVTFVATAEAGDDDMAARIARHRAERPAAWHTAEVPHRLAAAVADTPPERCILVDCLTMWVTNRMLAGASADSVLADTDAVLDALVPRRGPTLLVSNEVGMGVVPANELGRTFRDLLGRVNARVAARAGQTVLVVAGRVLPLLDPATICVGATDASTPVPTPVPLQVPVRP